MSKRIRITDPENPNLYVDLSVQQELTPEETTAFVELMRAASKAFGKQRPVAHSIIERVRERVRQQNGNQERAANPD